MKNAFLVGEKTYLRPVELSDTPWIQQWHNDPEIRTLARMGELPVTYMKEEHDISNAKASEDEVYLIIMEKSSDRPIGFVRLNFIDPVARNMWLRFVIGDTKAFGKGLARDALQQVLQWLFAEQNIHRVTLETYETNERAIRFFERLGFKREGLVREAVYIEGEYYNIIAFGILKSEFRSR